MPESLVEPTYYYSDIKEIGGGDGVFATGVGVASVDLEYVHAQTAGLSEDRATDIPISAIGMCQP